MQWTLFHSTNSLWVLLLLLSRFSHVQLCATPETATHQAPPSLGFSRQEHWSGLPFPSPMHKSEKWSRSVMSNSLKSHGLQSTRLLCPWAFPGKSTGVGCHCLLHSSDLGAPQNKVSHYFHCFPIYLPWSDGTRCHDLLVFWMLSFKLLFHPPLLLSSSGDR